MARAVEAWLRSEDHERFAAAAMKCEHMGAFCIADGYCHLHGECFRTDRSRLTAACRAIECAADDEPPDVAREMMAAVALLRSADPA